VRKYASSAWWKAVQWSGSFWATTKEALVAAFWYSIPTVVTDWISML